MDERLLKESYFLHEKGIMTYVKALTKEFARRRKSADAIVAHNTIVYKMIVVDLLSLPPQTDELNWYGRPGTDGSVPQLPPCLFCFDSFTIFPIAELLRAL